MFLLFLSDINQAWIWPSDFSKIPIRLVGAELFRVCQQIWRIVATVCERALKEMYTTRQENQQLEKSSKKLTVNIVNKTKIIDIGMVWWQY